MIAHALLFGAAASCFQCAYLRPHALQLCGPLLFPPAPPSSAILASRGLSPLSILSASCSSGTVWGRSFASKLESSDANPLREGVPLNLQRLLSNVADKVSVHFYRE